MNGVPVAQHVVEHLHQALPNHLGERVGHRLATTLR